MKATAAAILSLLAASASAADLVCEGVAELPCSFGLEQLDVTPVPAGLDLQARLVRAGVPVQDGVLNLVAVRLLRGTDLVCLEQHSNVPVVDSVVNLRVGVDESECFTRAITQSSDLAIALCIDGGTTCMKPMSLGVAPSVLKASYAHTAQTANRAEVAYSAHHALRMAGDRDTLVRRAIGSGYFDPSRPTDAQLAGALSSAEIAAYADGGFLSWVPTGDPDARALTFATVPANIGRIFPVEVLWRLRAGKIRTDGGLEVGTVGRGGWAFLGGNAMDMALTVSGDSDVKDALTVSPPGAVGAGGFEVLGAASVGSLAVKGHWLVNAGLTMPGAASLATAKSAELRNTTVAGFGDIASGATVVDQALAAAEGLTVQDGFELVGPSGEVVTVALVPIPGTTEYELQLDPIGATARVNLELPTVFEKPVAFLNEATFEDPKSVTRCAEGYGLTVSATGAKGCVDENECLGTGNQSPQNLCPEANKVCVNRKRTTEIEPTPATDPGYTCECGPGWVANGSGTCVAENECTTSRVERRHTCGVDQICVDAIPGQGDDARGYSCACPTGQVRSGDACAPIDECAYVGFTNVAVGKPATQSTIFDAGKSFAHLANDGNTSGIYPISHTLDELEPWWQVDLGQPYAIERVVLWRRTECCELRLTNIDIRLSMGDPTLGTATTVGTIGVPTTTTIPVQLNGARGRYLRIQMRNTGTVRTLELGEVQVFVKTPVAAPTGIGVNCPVPSECVDTATGFDCACWPGYTKSGAGPTTLCGETNECTNGSAVCPANSDCANLAPGGSGACAARTICKPALLNTPGSGFGYACACRPGYVVSPDGLSCVDVNECTSNPCGAGGTCTNQAPGYACGCAAGYDLTGALSYGADGRASGVTCVPVNECASAPCGAGATQCTDLTPGYACTCQGGFRSAGQLNYSGGTGRASGVQCAAINECNENGSICADGTCSDTTPGYSCSCRAGFQLSGSLTYGSNGAGFGVSCADINECGSVDCCAKFSTHHCQWGLGGNSSCAPLGCTNNHGSATCHTYFDYSKGSWGCQNDQQYNDTFTGL